MQLTIDTRSESLDEVIRVIGAAYRVTLTLSPADDGPDLKPGRASTAARTSGRSRRSGSDTKAPAREVRRWAAENGHEVSSRGAIPKAISDAYAAAH